MKARFAQLMTEPFCLPIEQIARMTDRQIAELCYHKRNKDGAIEVDAPEVEAAPLTPGQELATLLGMAQAFGIPADKVNEAWGKKYGAG